MASELGWFVDQTDVEIRTITPTSALVAPGQNGIGVTMDVENVGLAAIDVTAVDLRFADAGGMDLSSEYVVTPDPGNPTSVPAIVSRWATSSRGRSISTNSLSQETGAFMRAFLRAPEFGVL